MKGIDNTILIQASEILNFVPKSEQEAIEALRTHLSDLDAEEYLSIEELPVLIEIVKIMSGEHKGDQLNPFKRTGGVISTDQYIHIPSFKRLRFIAEEAGWKLKERKYYYNFIINNRVFFKVEGVRKTIGDNHSCRIIIPRITDLEHLDLVLNTYALFSFRKEKDWSILTDKKISDSSAHGKYFFISELEKFALEIPERI